MASLGYTPTADGWLPAGGWLPTAGSLHHMQDGDRPEMSPEMVFRHLAQKFKY
jgi:hypothetical protein